MSDAPKLSPSFVLDLSRIDDATANLIRKALRERQMIAVSEGSAVQGIIIDVATYDDLVIHATLEQPVQSAEIKRLH